MGCDEMAGDDDAVGLLVLGVARVKGHGRVRGLLAIHVASGVTMKVWVTA